MLRSRYVGLLRLKGIEGQLWGLEVYAVSEIGTRAFHIQGTHASLVSCLLGPSHEILTLVTWACGGTREETGPLGTKLDP